MNNLFSTDYVVYDNEHQDILRFSNGDIIIYGNKAEAEADCKESQVVISCTDLPLHIQKLIEEIIIACSK
jgi:hypothetical protein